MKSVEVVAAIIVNQGNFLCVQRGKNKYEYISYKYEFPGGKVEAGESRGDALFREIREELEIDIKILSEYMTVRHQYPDFHLMMHSFICTCDHLEKLKLNDHVGFKWLKKAELMSLDWAAADLPIVNKLQDDVGF